MSLIRSVLARLRGEPSLVDYHSIIAKAAIFVATEHVDGDYFEFGVFEGAGFVRAYRALEAAFRDAASPGPWSGEDESRTAASAWRHLRLFAFDSFEGLPVPKGTDSDTSTFFAGKYACSRERFEQNLASAGVEMSRVQVVPGWFSDTLTETTRAKLGGMLAAIVNIDCDLYEPARQALEFVTPLLQDGTVIVFDDWLSFRGNPNRGEQRACREWLAAHPEWSLTPFHKDHSPRRASFVLNRIQNSEVGR